MPLTRAPRYPAASPTSRIGASARVVEVRAQALAAELRIGVLVVRRADARAGKAVDEIHSR